MKKRSSFILAVLACIGLSACSSNSGSIQTTAASETTAQATESKAEDSKEAETPAADAEWPTGTVTVVVPAAAGSTIDLQARIYTTYLQKTTGQAFVVTNDTTGNGTVAYENVKNAKPDGSTLLWTQNLFIQSRGGIYNAEPWDNFEVLADCGDSIEQYVLVAKAGKPYTNWDEVVAYAKEHPGELVAGIQNGGQAHMLQAMLDNQAGIECQMVEAGSSGDKITGILGDYIDLAFVSTQSAVGYLQSGDLIALMTTTPEKSALVPDVPTSAELGYPDVTVLAKTQLFGPKGMDEGLQNAINKALVAGGEDADVKEQLDKLSVAPAAGDIAAAVETAKKSDELLKKGYEAIAQ